MAIPAKYQRSINTIMQAMLGGVSASTEGDRNNNIRLARQRGRDTLRDELTALTAERTRIETALSQIQAFKQRPNKQNPRVQANAQIRIDKLRTELREFNQIDREVRAAFDQTLIRGIEAVAVEVNRQIGGAPAQTAAQQSSTATNQRAQQVSTGQLQGGGVQTTQQQISSILDRIPNQQAADRILNFLDSGQLNEQQALSQLQSLATSTGPSIGGGPSFAQLVPDPNLLAPTEPLPPDDGGNNFLQMLQQLFSGFETGLGLGNLSPSALVETAPQALNFLGNRFGGTTGEAGGLPPTTGQQGPNNLIQGPPIPLGLSTNPNTGSPNTALNQALNQVIDTGQFPNVTGLSPEEIVIVQGLWQAMTKANQFGIATAAARDRLALETLQNIQSDALQQGQLQLAQEIAATNQSIAARQLQHSQAQLAQVEAQLAQQGTQFNQQLDLQRQELQQDAQFFQQQLILSQQQLAQQGTQFNQQQTQQGTQFNQQLALNQQQLAQQQKQFEIANPFNIAASNILSGQGNLNNQFGQPLANIGFQVPEGAAPGQQTQASSFFGGTGLPTLGAINQLPPDTQRLLSSLVGATGTSQEELVRQSANITPSSSGQPLTQVSRTAPVSGRR